MQGQMPLFDQQSETSATCGSKSAVELLVMQFSPGVRVRSHLSGATGTIRRVWACGVLSISRDSEYYERMPCGFGGHYMLKTWVGHEHNWSVIA